MASTFLLAVLGNDRGQCFPFYKWGTLIYQQLPFTVTEDDGLSGHPKDKSKTKMQTPNLIVLRNLLNVLKPFRQHLNFRKSASLITSERWCLSPEHVMLCFQLRKLHPLAHSSAAGPLSTEHARSPHELPYVLPFIRSWVWIHFYFSKDSDSVRH